MTQNDYHISVVVHEPFTAAKLIKSRTINHVNLLIITDVLATISGSSSYCWSWNISVGIEGKLQSDRPAGARLFSRNAYTCSEVCIGGENELNHMGEAARARTPLISV
jgi:hypothetical protein